MNLLDERFSLQVALLKEVMHFFFCFIVKTVLGDAGIISISDVTKTLLTVRLRFFIRMNLGWLPKLISSNERSP